MGAGGRDFHDFNVVFRYDPAVSQVVATVSAVNPTATIIRRRRR